MRIIAGEFRGRRLLSPTGEATRPITDRVKQSLFDILSPLLDGAAVYDCFAGTGSMGLECLSRGAASAVFFESDRSAATLLRKNMGTLGVAARASVVDVDLFRWFARTGEPEARRVDLVFLDPPYRFLTERPEQLRQLAAQMAVHHLQPGGTVVFRHDAGDSLALPALAAYDARTYGSMAIELLRPSSALTPQPEDG